MKGVIESNEDRSVSSAGMAQCVAVRRKLCHPNSRDSTATCTLATMSAIDSNVAFAGSDYGSASRRADSVETGRKDRRHTRSRVQSASDHDHVAHRRRRRDHEQEHKTTKR